MLYEHLSAGLGWFGRSRLRTQTATQMTIESDIAQSREYEMRTYLRSMKAMYENAIEQNGEIYDIA